MDKQKYTIQELDEYIRQSEPEQHERGEAWRVAIGLQQVDGLTPSAYLVDTAKQHIDGKITIGEAKALIESYYQSATTRKDVENDRTEEADKVSARIAELLSEKTFNFSPAQLISIHRRLFEGIYKLAGRIRDYNITKNEWVLKGETIYLERFFRSMLLGEVHSFRNRELHIDWKDASATDFVQSAKEKVQSAKFALNLPSKCKSCTLEEIAVLRMVQAKTTATQKEMAAEIGKSERTIKSITVTLQEKGILQRVGGKRDGRWEIVEKDDK